MLKVEEFIEVIKLDNLVDAYQDELDYPSFRDWSKQIVMVRKELAEKLIDDSYVINEMVKFVDDYIRQVVELGIVILLEDIHKGFEEKSISIKALSAADYLIYEKIFNQELAVFGIHNEPRLWGILGVGYGQGMSVGLGDLGIPSNEADWQLFRETAAYRQLAFQNLLHISNSLGQHVKGVVAAGVTEGVNPYEIARRLREIKIGPKIVKVAPKIVNGKEVRTGYQYIIPQKRYAEMIARTESSRAINQGRLDAYRRTGIKQVEWLSAGDDRVCDDCMDLDGRKFPVDNAPLIPLHVACRCLTSWNVPIYTINGYKPINKIKKGDFVLTHKGRFKEVTKIIRSCSKNAITYTINTQYDKYTQTGNYNLNVTSEHPFLTKRGWVEAQDLTTNDEILMLASKCKYCNKKIPGSKHNFCSESHRSKYNTHKQWEDEEIRNRMCKSISETNISQYKSGIRDRFKTTLKARQKMKQLAKLGLHPFQNPESMKKAAKIRGQKNHGDSKLERFTRGVLLELGIDNFIQQYPVKRLVRDKLNRVRYYFADFAFPELKLIIECDGYYHSLRRKEDEKRNKELEQLGWDVFHLDAKIILNKKKNSLFLKNLLKNHNNQFNYEWCRVSKIEKKLIKLQKRYNLSVKEDESFIAKDFVVHNCTYIVAGKITDEGRRDAKEGIKLDSDELLI